LAKDGQRLDLRALIEAAEAAPPIEAVDVLAAVLAEMLDATHVSLLIANFSGTAVMRVSHIVARYALRNGRNERVETLGLADSAYERVMFTQELEIAEQDDGWLLLLPITERGDAIGILELSLPIHPDSETVAYLVSAAHALAYVLIASRRHTDLFEWAQRDIPFSLAAEIQRRLLPSAYTAEGGPFTLAGWLEPAHEAAGDTFDYSIDREYLYASITDAMGHSTDAALLATVLVNCLRNRRRALASPAEQADAANAALLAQSNPEQFVTGQILRIRLRDGAAELVNAGHPRPYLLRDGRAAELDVRPDPAFGIDATSYRAQVLQFQPGDRILLVTDGFLERNAVTLDIAQILVATIDRHPRQIVRELADRVLQVTGGKLRDDATVVCIDWYGPTGERNATGGASRSRATPLPRR
jgi:serine phosphatase RsbU (regulator of sigma subunit)